MYQDQCLTWLHIDRTLITRDCVKLTDKCIPPMLSCSAITLLDLSRCYELSTKGLLALSKRLKRLRVLKLADLPQLTPEVLQMFIQK